uniref:Uncharacterized protein n=1 Tax=Acrobeloides nanus TaxID=290746 RepID=A0A914DXW6_9BILA
MAFSPISLDTDSPPRTPQNYASFEEKQRTVFNGQQRRATTILASMVLIFGLAWLPQNIVTLIIEYDDTILQRDTVNYAYIISMIAHRPNVAYLARSDGLRFGLLGHRPNFFPIGGGLPKC